MSPLFHSPPSAPGATGPRRVAMTLVALLCWPTASAPWADRDLSSADPGAQIGEPSRGGPTPADQVRGGAVDGLGHVDLPLHFFAPLHRPEVLPLSWREIGTFRPGHPPRIDRPPRAVA